MRKPLLLSLLLLGVYLLHQDCWNWNKVEPLALGFLPVGLWYHAAYSILASMTMAVLVKFAWPQHLEAEETRKPAAGSDTGEETK